MFSWIIALLFTSSVLPKIFANGDRKMNWVFGARCDARCFAKCHVPECNETLHEACIKPCDDLDFFKVKSCKKYCIGVLKGVKENRECRSSCKYLLRLYNEDGASSAISAQFSRDGNPSRPTAVNITLTRKPTLVAIRWSHNSSQNTVTVYLIEARYLTEKPFVMTPWEYVTKTRLTNVKVSPNPVTWCEYRIKAVNQDGTSDYSSPSPPVFVMPEKPSMPRDFRIDNMGTRKGKVFIQLGWSKPEKSDVPVHRYRIFWSPRLDEHTKELKSLRVFHKKIAGNKHSDTIQGLIPNTTYVFEIQAICHFKGKRLRSRRVYLTTRTLEKEPEKKIKPMKKKKKVHKKNRKPGKTSQSKFQTRNKGFKNNNKPVKPKATQSSHEVLQSTDVKKTIGPSAVSHLKASNSSSSTISSILWFVTTVLIIAVSCLQ